ncbi:MAG: MFS transporter [Phycisphaerales bacterium]
MEQAPDKPDPTVAEPSARDAAADSSLFTPLAYPHFRIVWIAAFLSFLGSWFEFVGAQWIVGSETESTVWMSNLGSAQLLPSLFLGLLGGIVADRVNRRKLIIFTQTLMMLIALEFAAAVWTHVATPRVLFMLSLAQGIVTAFNSPAWQVLTPRLVPREQLYKAITLQGISFNSARTIGPAIAGLIMGWAGAGTLFAANALGFVCVMLAVTQTPDAPAPARKDGRPLLSSMIGDTREALSFVFHNPGPRAAFLATTVFGLFATPVLRFLPLTVKLVYGREESTFGIMTGIMGAGAVAGGLAIKHVPKWYPKHHLIPLSVLLGGVWILAFSLSESFYAAGCFMFFVGFFWMWAFNTSMGAMQMLVPDHMRGRVLSVVNTLALGLMPVGAYAATIFGRLISGGIKRWHAEWWSEGLETQAGVGAVALILIGAGLVMITWRTPEVDGLKPGDPGYDRTPGLIRGLTAMAHRPPPRT